MGGLSRAMRVREGVGIESLSAKMDSYLQPPFIGSFKNCHGKAPVATDTCPICRIYTLLLNEIVQATTATAAGTRLLNKSARNFKFALIVRCNAHSILN